MLTIVRLMLFSIKNLQWPNFDCGPHLGKWTLTSTVTLTLTMALTLTVDPSFDSGF
jgi:hypothetical protein